MKPGKLMGRLSNGNEADRGVLIHAVPDHTKQYGDEVALCGARPGRRSGGWDVDHQWVVGIGGVNCIRCVSKLQKLATEVVTIGASQP